MEEDKICEDCKYYMGDYWNCQGEDEPCHEFVESEEYK